MKAMILRVGIDKGCGGCLGPIFPDKTFEYIPIPELDVATVETRTYNNTRGMNNTLFSDYVPPKIHDLPLHYDPEFVTYTYGDATSKRKSLIKLESSDLLVFYAGLEPYKHDTDPSALYIIGYFTVKEVTDFNQLNKEEIRVKSSKYSNNAHIKRKIKPKDLVIVEGYEDQSKLLEQAIPISEPKVNKIGRTYHGVSKEMEEALGIKGSIQRSIPPRFINETLFLENLKGILNIKF